MKKQSSTVIVMNGMRLCQDGNFRSFAQFGTFSNCVKQYRTIRGSSRKFNDLIARANDRDVIERITLYIGDTMDVAGNVTRAGDSRMLNVVEKLVAV